MGFGKDLHAPSHASTPAPVPSAPPADWDAARQSQSHGDGNGNLLETAEPPGASETTSGNGNGNGNVGVAANILHRIYRPTSARDWTSRAVAVGEVTENPAQRVTTPVEGSERQVAPRLQSVRMLLHGLYAGEPETCRRNAYQFACIWGVLALLTGVFARYELEGRAFLIVMSLVTAALPLHYAAPLRAKKPVFLGLALLTLTVVFGVPVAATVSVCAILAILLTRLPVPWALRAGLVAGFGAGLLAVRPVWADTVPAAWPILGSMMMFRMIIYLYELKHARSREPFWDALTYFFLPPNACFIHFPVVDYRTFQRVYFLSDIHLTQRLGLRMMYRGTLQLLLYRIVYHDLLIPQADVHDPKTLAQFLICNYLLYLRVSGQFHLASGALHLFGYKMPETHHNYLLANSFTDYWRRINIYWKDFMVRVVFNPIVFALKKRPQPLVLAIATLAVFFVTWFLHAYQMYWLRGEWGFRSTDAWFWGILGVCVLVNVQLDARRSRRGARGRKAIAGAGTGITYLARIRNGIQIGAMLLTITLLWSLWSSPTLTDWIDMLKRGLLLG